MNPLARAGGFKQEIAKEVIDGKWNPLARAGGFKLVHHSDSHWLRRNPLARAGGFKQFLVVHAFSPFEPARKSGWI